MAPQGLDRAGTSACNGTPVPSRRWQPPSLQVTAKDLNAISVPALPVPFCFNWGRISQSKIPLVPRQAAPSVRLAVRFRAKVKRGVDSHGPSGYRGPTDRNRARRIPNTRGPKSMLAVGFSVDSGDVDASNLSPTDTQPVFPGPDDEHK